MSAIAGPAVVERLELAYRNRIVLISPPRTGSTVVTRLLWEQPEFQYHCHEPYEAPYWGRLGGTVVADNLCNPMKIASGARRRLTEVPPGSGVLLKEMSFQLDDEQFTELAGLATTAIVFVVRDPLPAAVSRLRILAELNGQRTFPPAESGWPALDEQVTLCKERGLAYVIVDSDDLRAQPEAMTDALLAALGLASAGQVRGWAPRPGLSLCAPDVSALMGAARATDDPFYRRVLASTGIQPPDDIDRARDEAVVADAGLAQHVRAWSRLHQRLRADSRRLTPTMADRTEEMALP